VTLIAELVVASKIGLHARPANKLVQELEKFESDVFLEKDNEKVNAKSIIGVLMLAATHGSTLTAYIDGPDADDCLTFLQEFFATGFGGLDGTD